MRSGAGVDALAGGAHPMGRRNEWQQVYYGLLMVFNITVVVGLVGVLKCLYSHNFWFTTTLVSTHFMACGIVAKGYKVCRPFAKAPTVRHVPTTRSGPNPVGQL